MVKKAQRLAEVSGTVDVACVIHGSGYDWCYVERLHSMVTRNVSHPVRFHVFTEHDRSVPGHMIKHILEPWPGLSGPKKSWWYKMQLFDAQHIQSKVLYLDLDVVITQNIDWIWHHATRYFWALKDFRHLWKPAWQGINSSVMLWDTLRYDWIWKEFTKHNIAAITKQFHGDQDYLNSVLDKKELRHFPVDNIKSWRWQIKDGGLNMKTRVYNRPGAGSTIDPATSIVVFHGQPKPHDLQDLEIQKYWC